MQRDGYIEETFTVGRDSDNKRKKEEEEDEKEQ